jgi:hypothetical protein
VLATLSRVLATLSRVLATLSRVLATLARARGACSAAREPLSDRGALACENAPRRALFGDTMRPGGRMLDWKQLIRTVGLVVAAHAAAHADLGVAVAFARRRPRR